MYKKRNNRLKRKENTEFSEEFCLKKFDEIEKNVLKLIKKDNSSSKKHKKVVKSFLGEAQ